MEQDIKIQNDLLRISKSKNKNERLSWNRKFQKLQEIIEKIKPLEEETLKLFLQKQDLHDEIVALRQQMVKECTHPYEFLVHNGEFVTCKFCNANLSIPKNSND